MKWEKTGHEVKANGESTVTYTSKDGHFQIESRKRAIPHAGGRAGYWMHTSYFLIDYNTGTEKEYYSLRDAKAAAEVAADEKR